MTAYRNSMHICNAYHCQSCDLITDSEKQCPGCGSGNLLPFLEAFERRVPNVPDLTPKLFERETAIFEAHRDEWWPEHSGKFAVIQDETVLPFIDTYEEAFRVALKAFGGKRPFLIRQIFAVDPVYFAEQVVMRAELDSNAAIHQRRRWASEDLRQAHVTRKASEEEELKLS